jgi:hypothetical protein
MVTHRKRKHLKRRDQLRMLVRMLLLSDTMDALQRQHRVLMDRLQASVSHGDTFDLPPTERHPHGRRVVVTDPHLTQYGTTQPTTIRVIVNRYRFDVDAIEEPACPANPSQTLSSSAPSAQAQDEP